MPPTISIVIVNYRSARDTIQCVDALRACTEVEIDLIVVDNASGGDDRAVLETRPDIPVRWEEVNAGYGTGCNLGAGVTQGRYLLFVNPDIRVSPPDALRELIDVADAYPELGALTCRVEFPDGRPQPSAHTALPGLWSHTLEFAPAAMLLLGQLRPGYWPSHFSAERQLAGVQRARHLLGAFLLVPRAAFDAVGGFDEAFFLYREETDLCVRLAERGLAILYTPSPLILHESGASTENRDWASLDARYMESTYRYFALQHGSAYARLAWTLAVLGLCASLPPLLIVDALRALQRRDRRNLRWLIEHVRSALRWHLAYMRTVGHPSSRRLVSRIARS
ncbi:MAG TPA: glycosyltransferase family 2 protein [Solirubrobacteraceae bacterium]|jgi:hypothetical protein|nr:glycosyltransferase family 2 protein [Solirubrobacteraceae bacterium]